jgi:hypothetical protein
MTFSAEMYQSVFVRLKRLFSQTDTFLLVWPYREDAEKLARGCRTVGCMVYALPIRLDTTQETEVVLCLNES